MVTVQKLLNRERFPHCILSSSLIESWNEHSNDLMDEAIRVDLDIFNSSRRSPHL